MATATAGELIRAGLRRAEMRDSATGYIQHPPSGGGEAFDLLNAAISALFDLFFEAADTSPNAASATFNTAAATDRYDLFSPASGGNTLFYHLTHVAVWDGSKYVPLERISHADRTKYPISGRPEAYFIEGSNLTLFPTPDAVYSIENRFELMTAEVDDDADTVNLQGPWKEFVVKHFAVACLQKEKSDTLELRQELWGPNLDGKGGLAQRIRDQIRKRDSVAPLRPVDVMGDDGAAGLPPYAVWTG
jgi:hypothetical protein